MRSAGRALVTTSRFRRILVLVAALSLAKLGAAGPDVYKPLFVIERSLNANVVHYDAKLTPDGRLDPHQPIIVYWVMAAEDGRRADLTLIEKTRAYGFTAQPEDGMNSYRMFLAAEKKREIHVVRQGDTVHAEMLIGGHLAYLQRIYINTRKALGFNVPNFVELFGVDVTTGERRYERVVPDR